MKCNTAKLSDIADIIVGFAFKSASFNTSGDGVRLVRGKNVTHLALRWGDDTRWWNDFSMDLDKYYLKEGDIVIGMDGSRVGKNYARVQANDLPLLLVQRVACIRAKDGADQDFIWSCISSTQFEFYVDAIKTGTSIPHISGKQIAEYPIPYFSFSEQKKIGSILRSLDDKIELNNKINENLEQQAQAIYQEWFVSQVDGHPDNYRKVSLADLMDYAGGSQPPASEFISEEREGYIRFVQIRDYESDSHLTYIPISTKNKICNEFDIMIARYGAALGRICFGLNGAYNVALAKVIPKQTYYREFLRCYLSSRIFYEGINNKGGRSAQAGFNQSDIKSFELFVPQDESVFHMFDAIVKPVFEYRLQLIKENQELTLLRDALLPSLMAGKIDISSIC